MNPKSIPQIIPVLPLPNLVFFPRTHLALHIPRCFYERLEEHSLPQNCFLGIFLRKEQLLSEAPVLPIGCLGKVVRSHPLPCGQIVHLDLHGLKRFQIREIWFEDGFSQAWIEAFEDQPGNLSPQRKINLIEALDFLMNAKQLAPGLVEYLRLELDDEAFLNLMCLKTQHVTNDS